MSILLTTVHVVRNIVSLDCVAGRVRFSTSGFYHVFSLDLHYNGESVKRSVGYDCKRETYLIYDFNVFSFLNNLFNGVVKYQFICHGVL
jgi:hypothetical protein